jgi:GT2 family glycosyltransferase
VEGKFLFLADEKLYVRGVTYGTFCPDEEGHEFPARDVVARDFELMAANNVNAVRTYTPPPVWLLDEAHRRGLRVMIGLAVERYVGYLNDGRGEAEIARLVCDGVGTCWGHPAILCYAIGNEIPTSTVRWFGRRRVERFLARLASAVRKADPDGLITYVSYPSTEYLQLPFVDVAAFNVYLEQQPQLELYLARLQSLAGERPLLMAELGLDSLRNGETQQASSVAAQIGSAFAAGCAGAFAYAWTDEWHRGGENVEDWAFGLTRRDRGAKPALGAVRQAFSAAPWCLDADLPSVSVVVCTFNGAATLAECLDGLCELDYPDYEVIVVNDGSTDDAAAIAASYPVRVISTANQGLSNARNAGLHAASGELIAYIDDDARPDRHWLQYLARTCVEGNWAAVGGPNLAPPGDGPVAECVANAPGAPTHVLLSDREAEHVPGCNMAVRRSALLALGGFDPQFRVAGDDVDLCWRLAAAGLKIGFSPSAVVWHHRRASLRAYLRQQRAYGRAEALLERKWPEKYNGARHVRWSGRLYGRGLARHLGSARRWRVYYGTQGSAPFQSLYERGPAALGLLALVPEWYLLAAGLSLLCALGVAWRPLLLGSAPLLAGAVALFVWQALRGGWAASFSRPGISRRRLFAMRAYTALLHLLQPAARLHGRLRCGLKRPSPRRPGWAQPRARRTWAFWSARWIDPRERLRLIEQCILGTGARMRRGGEYDRWDAEVEVGVLVRERLLLSAEEHAGGAQLIRVRSQIRYGAPAAVEVSVGALAALAALDHAYLVAALLGALWITLLVWFLSRASLAAAIVSRAVEAGVPSSTPLSRSRPSRWRLAALRRDSTDGSSALRQCGWQ